MPAQFHDFATAKAERELQHGFELMQPAGISMLDENSIHFIEELPPLSTTERLTRVEANLCVLGANAKQVDLVAPVFKQVPLEVQAGNRHYDVTLIAAANNPVTTFKKIKVQRAPWQDLLDEWRLLGFVPVTEPGRQGWFITRANNILEAQMQKMVQKLACAIHGKTTTLTPH